MDWDTEYKVIDAFGVECEVGNMVAAKQYAESKECTEMMVSYGLHCACRAEKWEVVQCITTMRPETLNVALWSAVRFERLEFVKSLLAAGAVPQNNMTGASALRVACALDNVDLVTLLLAAPGVDVNAESGRVLLTACTTSKACVIV